MPDCDYSVEIESRGQSRLLWTLLAINGLMFVVEFSIGLLSESMGLIADSLDMLADATVYGIGLYAVGHSMEIKIRAAMFSGVFQILLGLGILLEIAHRSPGDVARIPEFALFQIVTRFNAQFIG